jgi:basic membrane protein A
MKKLYFVMVALIIASMMLAACGPAETAAPTEAMTEAPTEAMTEAPTEAATEAPTEAATEAAAGFTVGQVTDLGGIDDKSFNASAFAGAEQAAAEFGGEAKYLESQAQADYAKNIQQYLDEDTTLIVTVGFLLGVDTASFAKANPDAKFAIVDYAYPDCWEGAVEGKDCGSFTDLPNVRGLTFQTDEAAMLAGYLAAGMSETGTVATYGGLPIPTVTIFMRGFEAGVKYYNAQKGTNVQLLGWNSATSEGTFTNNFESTDDGRRLAESFMQEGADIILPVAGPVGLGSAAVCKETGACKVIGVDADWYETAPEYKEIVLSSVLKKIDVAVYNTVKDTIDGNFTSGAVVYALKDGGVDIAPFHDFESAVSDELKAELEQLKADIISGAVTVDGTLAQ